MRARAVEHRLRDVDEPHGEARLREHLGDAVAHRAGADDADGLDHRSARTHEVRQHEAHEVHEDAQTFALNEICVLCVFAVVSVQIRSTASATPLPPPRHSVAMPRFRFRRFSA